jgi:hypothetical protein
MAKLSVQLHHVHDFKLASRTVYENPFRVNLTATFTHESGRKIVNLPGFYDGGKTWKVRFSPTVLGAWKGVTASGDPAMNGVELPAVTCVPNRNPAIRGQVRIDPRHPHRFVWEDGRAYIPLGFELDWLSAFHQRLGQPKGKPVNPKNDRFSPAMDLLVKRGFNYLVSNLYAHSHFTDPSNPYALTPPDMYCFGGTNDSPNHTVLNVDFFKDFDGAIAATHQRGLVVDLMIQVQNKRVNWPARRSWEDDNFWRYVVARYQAYCNVIWDVSKETFNILKHSPGHAYTLDRIDFIRHHDAYKHLLTAHDPDMSSYGTVSIVDRTCDYISDQIHFAMGYDKKETLASARLYNREAIRSFRVIDKPYINIEYGYEVGVGPDKSIDNNTCRPWQDMLIWTYALYAGGAFANYYYNNTSWNLVKFTPEPESWVRYRYLRDLLEAMDLGPMVPDNEFVERGMCLAERGRQYFIFLGEGGDESADLGAIPPNYTTRCAWMDIFTGKKVSSVIRERGFRVALANPLPDKTHPCAIYIDARP